MTLFSEFLKAFSLNCGASLECPIPNPQPMAGRWRRQWATPLRARPLDSSSGVDHHDGKDTFGRLTTYLVDFTVEEEPCVLSKRHHALHVACVNKFHSTMAHGKKVVRKDSVNVCLFAEWSEMLLHYSWFRCIISPHNPKKLQ